MRKQLAASGFNDADMSALGTTAVPGVALDPPTAVTSSGLVVANPEYSAMIRCTFAAWLRLHRRGFTRATEGCWRHLNFGLWWRMFLDDDFDTRTEQAKQPLYLMRRGSLSTEELP